MAHLIHQGKGLSLICDPDPIPLWRQMLGTSPYPTGVQNRLLLPISLLCCPSLLQPPSQHIKLYFLNEMSLADFWQNHNKKKLP